MLQRWLNLLAPNGRLILIEGRWSTGAGLRASECRSLVWPCPRLVDTGLSGEKDFRRV